MDAAIRQVVLGDDGGVHLVRAAAPAPHRPRDVLLAPLRLGICGSDVHVLDKRHPFVGPPVVTGHEGVARVLAAGPDAAHCAPGDLVVVNPLHTCGACANCRSGAENRCATAKVLGFALPGLAQDRVVVEDRYCHRVPSGLDPRTAVLTEPLAVGWHAVGRVAHPLGRVLVIGGGPVGLAVLTAVVARGADHVTLVEPVAEKRDLAVRLGADRVTAPDAEPGPADTAFDCVAAPATLAAAGAATVPGGTLVCVGVPPGDTPLPLARLQRWEIDVRGTGLYVRGDIDAVLAHLAADPGRAALAGGLVTAEYPVDRAADAFAATRDPRNIKVTIAWPEPGR
ncbi:MAG TPA: alcohol dehydrogenase catalytic domain-containing protein [Streptosporangiaceae bacterium]|jgi:threonine dehydrogenase-like Zn-dependent dehydrogenase